MLRVLFLVFLCLPMVANAARLNEGDYRYRHDVEDFIDEVVASSDYSEAELLKLFAQVKHQRHLFERMDKPAEKLDWYQYRPIFVTEKRANKGVEFWKKHRELLQRVEQEFQVPAEIIVAIIGVETYYGAYKGKAPVFDTLVTFAFDYPKRAKFFTRELKEFLLLSRENNLPVRDIKGSYAGAMGMPQFISSSYRNYAIDFDKDGKTDLFNSLPDIVGSVANYFKRHGWQAGQDVGHPLSVKQSAEVSQLETSMKPNRSWQSLVDAGFATDAELRADAEVALLRFEHKDRTEYWVGHQNFYVITRYNHSPLYAMAVYQLSQKLKQGMS